MKDLTKIPQEFHILFSDNVKYDNKEINQLVNEYNFWSMNEALKKKSNELSKNPATIQD
jgi:hypothetical protein